MDFISSLLFGEGIAHSMLVLSLVITVGIALSKIKIGGISLGVTWILFVGIAASHFGMLLDDTTLQFVKNFGLIIFVFSIGLQVGPSFFINLRQGGMKLISLSVLVVLLGVATTYVLHIVTDTPLSTMVGVMSGAVTNTPGLGAAQQTYYESVGAEQPNIAMGYAVAYPFGVLGSILCLLLLRKILRVRFDKEDEGLAVMQNSNRQVEKFSVGITNDKINGETVEYVRRLIKRQFVISRVSHDNNKAYIADSDSRLYKGDRMLIVCEAEDKDAIIAFLGTEIDMPLSEWSKYEGQLVSRRIVITRGSINGKRLQDLRLRSKYGINISRVNRAGVDLIPYQGMELQLGDKLMVVGSEEALEQVANMLGNSLKKLHEPHILTLFIGIAVGVLLGSIPLMHIPQPVKLGLAGGPLIVALLVGRFGTHWHLVTYTTLSANLMLREIGISLFLAGVGLGAGDGFIDAIAGGGYVWIGYSLLIVVLPLILVGIFGRLVFKTNFYTLMGVLSGSLTNPIALAYANNTAGNDMPAVGYSTVYPVATFLRVLVAQLLIMATLG